MKVLAGWLQPDSGTIARKPNLQVSVLAQNPDMHDDLTVLEQIFASMPPEFRQLNEYEAKRMLTRLGLADTNRLIGTLSGGERRRAALCAALIHPADVLVLDEPTNHLDTEMVQWLEDWLKKYRGGLVMVTHDRYFLERVVNHITELSRGSFTTMKPITPAISNCGSSARRWRRRPSASGSPSCASNASGFCAVVRPAAPRARNASSAMRN